MNIASLIGTILTISFVIGIHELGHFLTARYFNVKVNVFSLGFGKALYSKVYNGVEYRISLFPLGGYIRMDDNPNDINYIENKEKWQRILISLSGPFINILVGFLSGVVLLFIGRYAKADHGIFAHLIESITRSAIATLKTFEVVANLLLHIKLSDFGGVIGAVMIRTYVGPL